MRELRRLRRRCLALREENSSLRAQTAIYAGEAQFRQAIEASPVPLSLDDMKGTILFINRKFQEHFGYSAAELPTSTAWFTRAYPHAPYRRQVIRQWKALLARGLRRGKEIGPLEVEVTCKDGTVRRVDFIGTLMGDRLLVAANDVTERDRLEKQILRISEEERERIGQDLHDGLCQLLSGIKFKVTLLEQKLQEKGLVEAREAGRLESLLNRAIQQARNVARGLHPVDLEARGLMWALEGLAESVAAVYGVACFCQGRQALVHDHVVATHLYRIAQEATNNAIKHGQAKSIFIRLAGGGDSLVLSIRDDGVGMPRRAGKQDGMGLHLMEYRARAIGGSLEIKRARPRGVLVTCRCHLRKSSRRNYAHDR